MQIRRHWGSETCGEVVLVGECLNPTQEGETGEKGEGEGNRQDHILSIRFYDFRQSVGWVHK